MKPLLLRVRNETRATAIAVVSIFVSLITPTWSEDVLYQAKYYRNVELVRAAPGNKVILRGATTSNKFGANTSANGIVTVPWLSLSVDFRRQHAAEYKELLKSEVEMAELIRAMADPAWKEKVKARIKSMKEVETNLPAFRDKLIWIEGELEVSSYYGSRYDGAQETHFAFKIEGNGTRAYLYMSREFAEDVRKRALASGKVKVLCLVEIRTRRTYTNDSSIYAELYEARPSLD